MAKVGMCKLCRRTGKLVRAHILPNSFFQPCLSQHGHALLMRTEGYTSTLSTGIYDPELACEECERLFSPWDSYAKDLLLDFDWDAAIRADSTQPGIVKDDYDYPKLKLFLLSITWRMAATARPEFQHITIPTRLEALGDHLLHRDPGGQKDFEVLLSKFRGPAHQHPDLDPLKSFLDPHLTEFGGARCVRMYLADWCVLVNVGYAPFEGSAGRLSLSPSRPLMVVLRDFGTSKELDLMMRMARRH